MDERLYYFKKMKEGGLTDMIASIFKGYFFNFTFSGARLPLLKGKRHIITLNPTHLEEQVKDNIRFAWVCFEQLLSI